MSRTVRELGEFELIARLAARLPAPGRDVVVGIGDDVAVLAVSPERWLVATCDAQVAGVHFLPDRCDPTALGRKAVAINVSDVAAIGGRPAHVLVSLALPPETPVAFLEGLYDGIGQEAARWGAAVVGGNVARGASLVIDLAVLGTVAPDRVLRRSGARPGDAVLVTGRLGAAAAGLALIERPEVAVAEDDRASVAAAFATPRPRVEEAGVIAAGGGASAMIDVSDGLAADLAHVCEASGVGVRIEAMRLPIDDATRRVAGALGVEPLEWALGGGEDYELAFTVAAERADEVAQSVLRATGTAVARVGVTTPADAGRVLVLADGSEVPLVGGFRHY